MNRTVTLDLHNYQRMYLLAEAQVRQSSISDRNKDFIFRYRDACLLQQTCGKVRLIRVMGVLVLVAKLLGKDFDQASREDLQRLVSGMLSRQPPYSPETLGTYKAIVKRFYTWQVNPLEFNTKATAPPLVGWITTHVRTRDKKKLQRNDLLLPADIERVVVSCQNIRDKALVAVLWETGARIAEIGNLQIKHVTKTSVGFTLDLTGKTGQRTPLIVSSAPLLAQWLNAHPFKDNMESPVWVHYHFADQPRQLLYGTIRNLLAALFQRAGITKPVHPHLFRHSRATYVLANGLMTEAQAKAYFGWTPNTNQLATYAHLLASDANAAILRENKLVATAETQDELRAAKCYRCGELNASLTEYCTHCNAVLDLKRAYEHQQLHDLKEELFTRMFKVMVEKGLVDDAAREIHDAGLGATLKRLAQHMTGEQNITTVTRPILGSVGPQVDDLKENPHAEETRQAV